MALNLGGGSMTSSFNSLYLRNAQSMLNQSLMRLSSGKRILRPSDDPGGLAVSMKLQNALTVTSATKQNIDNAKSYIDTQDAALSSVGTILDRMSTLVTSYGSGTANTSDKASYASEFKELQAQLFAFKGEKFNSISLFSSQGISRNVYLSSEGSAGATISVSTLDLSSALSIGTGKNLSAQRYGSNAISISDASVSIGSITSAINSVASLRAQSGATSSRLQFSTDYLSTSMLNLEEARSRIVDVDVAEETTNMAKYNLQVYAASAALVQSNLNMGIVVDLLNFSTMSRR